MKREAGEMRVCVKLFAILRERAGMGEMMLDLPDGANVAGALDALREQVPAIGGYVRRVAYAVNCEYVGGEAALKEGDELALIPPVSGG